MQLPRTSRVITDPGAKALVRLYHALFLYPLRCLDEVLEEGRFVLALVLKSLEHLSGLGSQCVYVCVWVMEDVFLFVLAISGVVCGGGGPCCVLRSAASAEVEGRDSCG
jgi:hypothetical protein